ncbi:MAG: hypothetical protein IT436_13110 [Phycisphaerales bacterium]|nr:hypothetical protein [Phycisphaerales bacterium]
MGWFSKAPGRDPEGGREVAHPGGGFGSAREAIEALLERMYGWDREHAWATVEAVGVKKGAAPARVQVLNDELNLLQEELPEDIVEAAGLEKIGEALYRVAGADAAGMADVVDTVLRAHFGAEGDYAVKGTMER